VTGQFTPSPLLRLQDISKAFAGVQALREVSFELFPGEVHALVGENGAGKSTLIRITTGALTPDSGSIEVAGRRFDCLRPAESRLLGISCVYQQPALFPDLTIAENLGLRLEPFFFGIIQLRARRLRAQELLRRIGTEIEPQTLVRDLSMAQQQLVEIACAVGSKARILIMDEPTASLTRHEQQLLYRLVEDLRGQGTGIIYVSHRLDEILALSNRITVLRDGRNVATSKTSEMTEASLVRLMVGRQLVPDPAPLVAETFDACETQSGPKQGVQAPDNPAVLSVQNLGCSSSGISGITMDLRAGEIFGLAGLVGAGRTELARTLFGITPSDEGHLWMEGRPLTIRSPESAIAHRIAYVPEDRTRHGIILELPVAQNITMAIHRRLFRSTWLRTRPERALAMEQIRALGVRPPDPDAPAYSLSGGNQQKVSVARWLAADPKVLILDEPTQGVDIGAKNEIHSLVRRFAGNGMAVLLISSDLPELLTLSDRIGVMRAGRLVSTLPGRTPAHQVMALAFSQASPD